MAAADGAAACCAQAAGAIIAAKASPAINEARTRLEPLAACFTLLDLKPTLFLTFIVTPLVLS
jgi:hypothetical protein